MTEKTMKTIVAVLLLCLGMAFFAGCCKEESTPKKGITRDKETEESGKKSNDDDKITAEPTETPSDGMPAELVGTWKGVGIPDNNDGSKINLVVRIDEDGTGEYEFEQAGYRESLPFSIDWKDNRFTVHVPINNVANIGICSGTWELKNGKLILDITTEFANGRTYSYTAECEKQ